MSDIVIPLQDENDYETNRHFFKLEYEFVTPEEGHSFRRFIVDQSIFVGLSGYDYFTESMDYSGLNAPIYVDVYSRENIVISYDDDMDGVYEDRSLDKTSVGFPVKTHLLFTNKNDSNKNLTIDCTITVKLYEDDFQLYINYVTRSKGVANISGNRLPISFWKSLGSFDLVVDGLEVRKGNPFRLGSDFYKVKSYNPIENTITINKIGKGQKLYGTTRNLYVNESLFDKALAYHKLDKGELKDKDFFVFYFWDHRSVTCMNRMPSASASLRSLSDDIGVFHVSLMYSDNDSEQSKIKDLAKKHNLPGLGIIERFTRDSVTDPIVRLMDNRTYPNYVVIDSNYKILYNSEHANVSFTQFVGSLE